MVPPSGKDEIHTHHGVTDTVLVQPEQLFRAIFEQAAVGVALIETATGRFVRVNQRYCEIVGLSAGDMTATTFMAITHPDDLQVDLNNMEALKAGRIRKFSMEKRYFRSDGSIVWVDLTVSPLWEAGEQPNCHVAVVQDITMRKQSERSLAELNATLEGQVFQRTRELEESRRQLQAIVEGTSDAVFLKDPQGQYLLFNNAAGRFVGKRPDEVLGKDDRFIFPPGDAQTLMEIDRQTMDGGKTLTYEETLRTADGIERTFLSTKGPVFDAQGHIAGLFGISRDITGRKRMEDKLRRSEAFTTSIVDNLPLMVFIKDAENLRFLRLNKAGEQLLGYSERELLGKNDHDYFPKSVADRFTANDREVLTSGRLLDVPDEPIVIRDGTRRSLHTKKIPLVDHEGRAQYLLGISVDITARKQAEEALRQLNETLEQRVIERTESLRVSERFRKEILDSLSAYVVVLDVNGVIAAVNWAWEQAARRNDPSGLAGVSLGANYVMVCERAAGKSSEVRQALQGIRDVLAGRKDLFECEYLCVWPGHRQWFSMRVTPLSGRGGCVIAHEDITDRKKAEEALRDSYRRLQVLSRAVEAAKEQERSRLSRELHDEFGQVLSGLKLELTKISAVMKAARKPSAIGSQMNRAIGMVDRLFLSLREMVAALRPSLLEELGLRAAIEALVDDLTAQSQIQCRFVADGIDAHVRWSPEVEIALFRMAQELLSNVIRHAKATTVTITLGRELGRIVLRVWDNGRGFAVRVVGKKNRFGLRGVQERAELLGGSVTINSTSRVGTTVTVQIPVEIPASVLQPKAPAKDRTAATPKQRSRRGK